MATTGQEALCKQAADYASPINEVAFQTGYLHPADDASTKLRLDGEIWHRKGCHVECDDCG